MAKMKMTVTDKIPIRFRAEDPYWYNDEVTSDIVCTGGSVSSYSIGGDVEGLLDHSSRCSWQIECQGTTLEDPQVSVLTGLGTQSFSIDGTLTTNGHYWLVDCVEGKVWKVQGSTITDDILNFTGDFPYVAPSACLVTSSQTQSNTYHIHVRHQGRNP